MAHFARLNADSVVIDVIVVHNDVVGTGTLHTSESIGAAFCRSLFGADTVWKQTSYNATVRKNYAGIGYTYDAALDAFIPPQPYPSWLLDEQTCRWQAPIAYPEGGGMYEWDEAVQSWSLQEGE